MDTYVYLQELHPAAPGLALMVALWLVAFVIRTRFPAFWKPLTKWPDPKSPVSHMIQALPTTALGAAFAGWQLGGLDGAMHGVWAGAGAPLLHHVIKALPGPYKGAVKDAAKKWETAKKAGGVSLFLLLIGCSEMPNPHFAKAFKEAHLTACETQAVLAADQRATVECPVNDGPWAACNSAEDIEIELSAALEACE